MLVQAPVFVGLYHVLRSFNRTGTGHGGLGMTAQDNANTANYIFSPADVQSFLSARLFGAPISTAITSPQSTLESFAAHGGVPTVATIAAVAIPLMVIASLATHFNARASVARQEPDASANPQTAIMNKHALGVPARRPRRRSVPDDRDPAVRVSKTSGPTRNSISCSLGWTGRRQ